MADFFQDGPVLTNAYLQDAALRRHLDQILPADVRSSIEPGLESLGHRAVSDIAECGLDAERNQPKLVPYDPWGRRIDRIDTTRGWQELEKIAAEEGIVATAYERREGIYSRLHQIVRLFLYHASSAVASCPLAMKLPLPETVRVPSRFEEVVAPVSVNVPKPETLRLLPEVVSRPRTE